MTSKRYVTARHMEKKLAEQAAGLQGEIAAISLQRDEIKAELQRVMNLQAMSELRRRSSEAMGEAVTRRRTIDGRVVVRSNPDGGCNQYLQRLGWFGWRWVVGRERAHLFKTFAREKDVPRFARRSCWRFVDVHIRVEELDD